MKEIVRDESKEKIAMYKRKISEMKEEAQKSLFLRRYVFGPSVTKVIRKYVVTEYIMLPL
ncbi:MAG: hypothetical protein IJ772_04750 [Bacilli bacterium]|nr:hypothetical protein [Bacilli bacterium]